MKGVVMTDSDQATAVPLFHRDGEPSGIFYCSACRYVGSSEHAAKTCCAPKTCKDCGESYERRWGYVVCPRCLAIRDEKRCQERWEQASKISGYTWKGPIVTDGQEGYADGYWHNLDELQDWLEEEGKTLDDVRCYATTEVRMHAEAEWLVEGMCEEQHDEAYGEISNEAIMELQKMLDAWCEKHGTTSWFEDFTRALVFHETEKTGAT